MKIQTTVQVNEVVEFDIEFPYYCQTPDAFYYVMSEDKAIRVSNYNGCECVMVSSPQHSHTARQIGSAVAVTKSDFDAALDHALTAIIPASKLQEVAA
jgi:hypothetical protein